MAQYSVNERPGQAALRKGTLGQYWEVFDQCVAQMVWDRGVLAHLSLHGHFFKFILGTRSYRFTSYWDNSTYRYNGYGHWKKSI